MAFSNVTGRYYQTDSDEFPRSQADAPLKPPEFKRDEMGRFERRGADLIKKRGVIKRNTEGQFKKGTHGGPRAGAGRPPGSKNKIALPLKEAILAAAENAGGEEGMVGYLQRLAIENSSAFAGLLGKVLPTTLAASESDGGAGVKMVFERHIVWPDGHREIEGVTPKQLPAPDASHALPTPTDPTDDTNEGAV
jgi:hypothetical protein